jgi:hypothetical protein
MARYIEDLASGRVVVHFLDDPAASDNGTWFEVSGLEEKVLDVRGISGDTLVIYGSNEASIPLDATDGRQIGASITANGMYEIAHPVKYLKVKYTHSAGNVYADMCAKRGK